MNIYTSETEYLKTEVQRLSALVRAQQITIDKLEAQSEQEPVAWLKVVETPGGWGKFVEAKPNEKGAKPVYTSPPAQRTWVGLTKEEIAEFDTWHDNREEEKGWVAPSEIVAYISEKLRSKNT